MNKTKKSEEYYYDSKLIDEIRDMLYTMSLENKIKWLVYALKVIIKDVDDVKKYEETIRLLEIWLMDQTEENAKNVALHERNFDCFYFYGNKFTYHTNMICINVACSYPISEAIKKNKSVYDYGKSLAKGDKMRYEEAEEESLQLLESEYSNLTDREKEIHSKAYRKGYSLGFGFK